VRQRSLCFLVRRLFIAAILSVSLPGFARSAAAEPLLAAPDPFAEDGRPNDGVGLPGHKPDIRVLRLHHHWTGEELDVIYRIGDTYQPGGMLEINQFMRDWRCNKATAVDPRLVDRLYELQMALGSRRTMRLISAYRSEGYNASLLRAGRTVDPDSQHMFGRAADIFVPGVPLLELKKVAETVAMGGTGYYPFSGPRFIHVDTGPDRQWAEMDPAVRRKLNLPRRDRKPLKLDCSLTMAEVLREVPVGQVMAALPVGASTHSNPDFHPAANGRPWSEGDGPPHAAGDPSSGESLCQETGGMAQLAPLVIPSKE
jgi:uncharacterized protein YcbK (DUF882 family)